MASDLSSAGSGPSPITERKLRLMLGSLGEGVEGGIPAVFGGLLRGLEAYPGRVEYLRVPYSMPRRGLGKLRRLALEMAQLAGFVVNGLRYRPDVIHVQTSFDRKTIVRDGLHLLAARAIGRPFVVHAHGGEWHRIGDWTGIWQRLSRAYLSGCDHVIVTSGEERDAIRSTYGDTVRVSSIANPVALPADLGSRRPSPAAAGKKTLVFAARLVEAKGVLDVIRAAARLDRDDYRIHVYGIGELYSECQELIRSLGVESRVAMMGEVPLPALLRAYLDADAFVFPTYFIEGFPMALFYAVACGLPVLTTPIRAMRDHLVEPENCLWVEPRSPDQLAERIGRLLDDPDLRSDMSRANEHLARKFAPEAIAREYLEVYDDVLTRRA